MIGFEGVLYKTRIFQSQMQCFFAQGHITLSQRNTRQLWIPVASTVQSVPKTLQQVSRAVQQKHPGTLETRKMPPKPPPKPNKNPNKPPQKQSNKIPQNSPCLAVAVLFKHQAAKPPREQHLLHGRHSLPIQVSLKQKNQNL